MAHRLYLIYIKLLATRGGIWHTRNKCFWEHQMGLNYIFSRIMKHHNKAYFWLWSCWQALCWGIQAVQGSRSTWNRMYILLWYFTHYSQNLHWETTVIRDQPPSRLSQKYGPTINSIHLYLWWKTTCYIRPLSVVPWGVVSHCRFHCISFGIWTFYCHEKVCQWHQHALWMRSLILHRINMLDTACIDLYSC